MKKIISTLCLSLFVTLMFASVTPPPGYVAPSKNTVSALPVEPAGVTPGTLSISQFADMDIKDLEKMTGKKFGLVSRVAIKMAQKRAKKLLAKGKIKDQVFGTPTTANSPDAGAQTKDLNILALLSMIFGIVALIGYYGAFLFGPAAIVLGIIALKNGDDGRGMAIAGIIMGAIAMLLWILVILLIFLVFI